MLPSRGLRWSRKTVAIGRGRLEPLSARHCSSLVQNASGRSRPLLSNNGASSARIYTRNSLFRSSTLTHNAASIRFASTTPISALTSSPAASNPPEGGSTAFPTEVLPSSLDSATDLTTESLYDIPVHIGYLKSLGLDYGWGPTACMEWLLEHIHVYAGTPWWVSISLAAIATRAVLFKLNIDASDNGARMQAVRPLTDPLNKKMMAVRGDEVQKLQLRAEIQQIHKRAGIKLWRSFAPMIQIFTGYGMFVLLRGMALVHVPGMDSGGILWFQNLVFPDPLFILPTSTALVMYWVLRKGGETATTTASPRAMNILQVAFPAITLALTAFQPAALQVSFLVSSLLSLVQSSLFRQPAFRTLFKMYPLPARNVTSTSTPISYKGNMNVRAPLTQEELNKTYQESRPSATTTTASKQSTIGGFVTGTVQGAAKDIKTTFKDARQSAGELMSKGKESMAERQAKNDRAAAAAYEEKRQEQIRQERYEREQERRERQAARRSKRLR